MPVTRLSEAERRELAEYDKIVAFAQQVLSGTHPRVKLPSRRGDHQPTLNRLADRGIPSNTQQPPIDLMSAMQISSATIENPSNQRTRVTLPNKKTTTINNEQFPGEEEDFEIDYTHNYYKDLGVNLGDPLDSIMRGYQSKELVWSPIFGKKRWFSKDIVTRERTREAWFRAQRAYKILSDPSLRVEYDQNYEGPAHHLPHGDHGRCMTTANEKASEKEKERRAVQAAKLRRENTAIKLSRHRPNTADRISRKSDIRGTKMRLNLRDGPNHGRHESSNISGGETRTDNSRTPVEPRRNLEPHRGNSEAVQLPGHGGQASASVRVTRSMSGSNPPQSVKQTVPTGPKRGARTNRSNRRSALKRGRK